VLRCYSLRCSASVRAAMAKGQSSFSPSQLKRWLSRRNSQPSSFLKERGSFARAAAQPCIQTGFTAASQRHCPLEGINRPVHGRATGAFSAIRTIESAPLTRRVAGRRCRRKPDRSGKGLSNHPRAAREGWASTVGKRVRGADVQTNCCVGAKRRPDYAVFPQFSFKMLDVVP
jgi:hypothetical protein